MDEPKITSGMNPARRQQFEADIAQIRVRTGASANETRMTTAGLVVMVGGVALTIIAFVVSGNQSDTRDVLSSVILALAGVSLAVVGAAIFLRYSLGRFLRFWLLRLIYEQQPDA